MATVRSDLLLGLVSHQNLLQRLDLLWSCMVNDTMTYHKWIKRVPCTWYECPDYSKKRYKPAELSASYEFKKTLMFLKWCPTSNKWPRLSVSQLHVLLLPMFQVEAPSLVDKSQGWSLPSNKSSRKSEIRNDYMTGLSLLSYFAPRWLSSLQILSIISTAGISTMLDVLCSQIRKHGLYLGDLRSRTFAGDP